MRDMWQQRPICLQSPVSQHYLPPPSARSYPWSWSCVSKIPNLRAEFCKPMGTLGTGEVVAARSKLGLRVCNVSTVVVGSPRSSLLCTIKVSHISFSGTRRFFLKPAQAGLQLLHLQVAGCSSAQRSLSRGTWPNMWMQCSKFFWDFKLHSQNQTPAIIE